jgi:peptidyl-tRNA hydrolase
MSYSIGLQVLRAKVRGFQAAGTTISSRISDSAGKRKASFWDKKRELGTYTRYHLIAYGLLRDIPYEQRTRRVKVDARKSQRIAHDKNCRCCTCSCKRAIIEANRKLTVDTGKKCLKKTMATIKMGDKLYLVTRRDIPAGYQAVQSCHAMRQFSAEHPERDCEWFTNSNYLALVSVPDEIELMRLITAAKDHGLKCSAFREPDVGGQITAIAIEPHKKTAELCKLLPLALKEFK